MSDASGRYSSQFHFGNDFWLGSSTLCKEINVTNEKNLTGGSKNAPPYSVSFHVARMYLTLPEELELSVSVLVIIKEKEKERERKRRKRAAPNYGSTTDGIRRSTSRSLSLEVDRFHRTQSGLVVYIVLLYPGGS